MKLKNKPQIYAWLEANDLSAVLEELKRQLKASRSGSDFLRNATSLSAQLEKLRTDKVKGIISYDEETIAMNKMRDKMQLFIEKIEMEKEKAATEAVSKPKPPSQPIDKKEAPSSNSLWKWLAVPVVLIAVWWLFLRDKTINGTIKICTKPNIELNYCNSHMSRLELSETLQGVVATAIFKGQYDEDPVVTATMVKKEDDTLSKIFQLTIKEGGVGYSADLTPFNAVWERGHYKISVSFNGKPAGEEEFEIFGETPVQENIQLLPLDSIKVTPRN